jgi:DNA-binding NarL/FixJ family response regulator
MHATLLRCAFVTVSPLMRALLEETLSNRVRLEILAELDTRDGLVRELAGLRPDVVVIGLERQESDDFGADLLADLPDARLLLMSADGAVACLYDLRPYRRVLTDFSADQLVAALLERGI